MVFQGNRPWRAVAIQNHPARSAGARGPCADTSAPESPARRSGHAMCRQSCNKSQASVMPQPRTASDRATEQSAQRAQGASRDRADQCHVQRTVARPGHPQDRHAASHNFIKADLGELGTETPVDDPSAAARRPTCHK